MPFLSRDRCVDQTTKKASGAKADRPVLMRLLDNGRSLLHLIETVNLLNECGVRSPTENLIDTTTPSGKFGVRHLRPDGAEFERDMLRLRTHAGLAAACKRGRGGGRPSTAVKIWPNTKKKSVHADSGRDAPLPS